MEMEMDIDERRELQFQMNRMFRDAEWEKKYEEKMRAFNSQRRVGANGQVVLKREVSHG
jgi:hypothetical protein